MVCTPLVLLNKIFGFNVAYPENHLGSGASGETRTLTLLPEPDFESGASTSSATEAGLTPFYIQLAMLTNQFIRNF